MGRPIKRQFLDFNVPSTTQGHLRRLVKKKIKKKNTDQKETLERKSKITEVKRALQHTKENRTPKVEKLSGTQSKKIKKGEKQQQKTS